MKKVFLSILVTIAFAITMNAQTSGLTIQGGYSWLNGVVGVEAQFGNIGFSGGYYPAVMPHSGTSVASYSGAITYYGKKWDESCSYVSYGIASAGYRAETYGTYGTYDQEVMPMSILMIGYRYTNGSGLSSKLGFGYGWCSEMNAYTAEWTIGYTLPW